MSWYTNTVKYNSSLLASMVINIYIYIYIILYQWNLSIGQKFLYSAKRLFGLLKCSLHKTVYTELFTESFGEAKSSNLKNLFFSTIKNILNNGKIPC